MKTNLQGQFENTLVDGRQARSIVGVLAMLIRMVGPCSSLGIVLQQARSEIVSLVHSDEEAASRSRIAA